MNIKEIDCWTKMRYWGIYFVEGIDLFVLLHQLLKEEFISERYIKFYSSEFLKISDFYN